MFVNFFAMSFSKLMMESGRSVEILKKIRNSLDLSPEDKRLLEEIYRKRSEGVDM